jgi:hypothetical protein
MMRASLDSCVTPRLAQIITARATEPRPISTRRSGTLRRKLSCRCAYAASRPPGASWSARFPCGGQSCAGEPARAIGLVRALTSRQHIPAFRAGSPRHAACGPHAMRR